MYYCNLKIHLITCNEMDEIIEKVRPMENFSHEFITHDKLGEIEADDVNEDTVIIVNDDKNWSLVELAKYKRYGAIIVLVTNQPEVFMESELMMFNYIWTLPLTPNLMRYYFRKLQNDLKIAKDFWLNKNFLDSLTKLTNRQYFYEYIAENRGDNFMTICYVDLENLDTVNDKFGYSVGDAALTSTADILRTTFPDELVTRLGGDEFVVTIVGEYPRADLIARLNFLISETAKLYEKNELLQNS